MLLASADGELTGREQARVNAHLKECWACRSRLSELEQAAQALAKLAEDFSFPGPERVASAKASFLTWMHDFERDRAARRYSLSGLRAVTVFAALVLLVAPAVLWMGRNRTRTSADDVLTQASRYEQLRQQAGAPVHQVMNIEVLELSPGNRRGGGRLELWSDRKSDRYSSRWTDGNGQLRHAVWQSGPGRALRYARTTGSGGLRPAEEEDDVRSVSIVNLQARRFEEFEEGVLHWVRHRAWRPVEVTGDFGRFVSTGGIAIDARRVRSKSGQPALRLTARRQDSPGVVEFVLELDPVSYRPRLQEARYRTEGKEFVVRLDIARDEIVPAALVAPAVFEPEREMLSTLSGRNLPRPLPLAPPAIPRFTPASEVEAMFAQHRLGACTRDTAEPGPAPDSLQGNPAVQRLIEQRLTELDSRRTSAQIRDELTALADRALKHASALRDLAEWATAGRTASLTEHEWRLLEAMIDDHAAALRSHLARSRGLLEPLLTGLRSKNATTPPHGAAPEAESWGADAAHVLAHVERVRRHVHELFAQVSDPPGGIDLAVSELLEDLPTAEQELGWLRAGWAQVMREGRAVAALSREP